MSGVAASGGADLRLRQIAFAAHDMDLAEAQLRAAFGLPAGYHDPGIIHYGLRNTVLRAGGDFLEIVEPVRADASAARYLARRGGDAGYMVIFQAADALAHREQTRAQGAAIVDVLDHREHQATHYHPREFDGVLVSIDAAPQVADWRRSDSFWHPAGPDWQSAAAGDVVGIAEVAIASADPAGTAARWGRMIDAAPRETAEGWRIDLLHHAAVRFVPAARGVAPGISGLVLYVAGLPAARARIASASVPMAGDAALICNVPIRVLAAP